MTDGRNYIGVSEILRNGNLFIQRIAIEKSGNFMAREL